MIPGDPEKENEGQSIKEKQIDEVIVEGKRKRSFWRGFGRGVGSFFTGIWKNIKRWPASVGLRGKKKAVEVYREETKEQLEAADTFWYVAHNTSEVIENIKSDSEVQGELTGGAVATIGTAVVTRGKGGGKIIPKVINKEFVKILKGKGIANLDKLGIQKIVENRNGVSPKWVGSKEWKAPDVPGSTLNGTRILQHPDGRWGYVSNHDYTKVIEIPTSSPVPYMNK